jgi:hypothetical protein
VTTYLEWDPATAPVCRDERSGVRTYCHPKFFAPTPNQLFRNRGDGTFEDVSVAAGIAHHSGKGMSVALADVNGNGQLDLFVGGRSIPGRYPEPASSFLFLNRDGSFVIDAEIEYERNNQYAKADRYIRKLRRLVGPKFRLGFTSFPYTHYHRAMPYSVFLGPGGATANLPQIYWKTIGDTAKESISITWRHNALYRRKIYPLGQTYSSPSARSVVNFRRFVQSYGTAPSWWSWQHTGKPQWQALRKKAGPFPAYRRERSHMVLRSGSRGDQVVWLQQHLRGAGYRGVPVSGIFDQKTRRAVEAFQRSRSLLADGVVGTATWNGLLKVEPVRIKWSGGRSLRSTVTDRAPESATLPPVRNELAGKGRRGPARSG